MELIRAQATLKVPQLCLEHRLWDSAANRAYFAAFQAAIFTLPHLIRTRNIGDYLQPAVVRKRAKRAVRLTHDFFRLVTKEVSHCEKTTRS